MEALNTRLRLLTRMAFGFRSVDALIALAMLTLASPLPATTREGFMNPRKEQRSPESTCLTLSFVQAPLVSNWRMGHEGVSGAWPMAKVPRQRTDWPSTRS